jgi:hypothetical protein
LVPFPYFEFQAQLFPAHPQRYKYFQTAFALDLDLILIQIARAHVFFARVSSTSRMLLILSLLIPFISAWNVTDCGTVANAWLHAKIPYDWTANTKQYVTFGKGLYRADCSGFVSAAWNIAPPGMQM